jgi:hypothetical protein
MACPFDHFLSILANNDTLYSIRLKTIFNEHSEPEFQGTNMILTPRVGSNVPDSANLELSIVSLKDS